MDRKYALVTGSSKGIGREIAIVLAKNGYNVAINYSRSRQEAEEVSKICETYGGRTILIQADVAKKKEIDRMFAEYKATYDTLDLMVNNAGITKFKPFLEVDEELWDEITNLNYKGAYFCAQGAAKIMVENGTKGVIINITSVHASINFPTHNIYGPNKAALKKLTMHEAMELAKYGIRVNAIAPGCICNSPAIRNNERQRLMASRVPLRRVGECEEVAEAVVFLASDKASYITGINLDIEGGMILTPMIDYEKY
jgi:NAD(P)-dependent dehydrogenase (short-subunit alcohol dehydrogenase family)